MPSTQAKQQAPSSRRKALVIIVLFVCVALLMLGMIYLQNRALDGVRAYVRGEGIWAKAQKDAVLHLSHYSYRGAPSDYTNFQQALEVIRGDTLARLALSANPPDIAAAEQAFLRGQNHPQDVDALIWFFLNFQQLPQLREAIVIWQEADQKVAELEALAKQFQQLFQRDTLDTQQLNQLRNQLTQLNGQLLELENQFSTTLGQGAHWANNAILLFSLASMLVFVALALLISYRLLQSISATERQLRFSEERYHSLYHANTLGIISWRDSGEVIEANDYFLQMLGYQRSDLEQGRINWRELTPAEYIHLDEQALEQLRQHGRCEPFEKAYRHRQGQLVPIYIGGALLHGEELQGIAFVVDLSERKQAEAQIRLLAKVFSASQDGVMITDPQMRIIEVNDALCRMTGFAREQLKGTVPRALQSAYLTPEQYRDMLNSIYLHGHWQGDIVDRNHSGEIMPLHISLSAVKDDSGHTSHYVAIASDISQRQAREAQLRHIAEHDTLTGLPNRVLFNDRAEQMIRRATRQHSQFALVFIDLNDFKQINDRYGHLLGDKLLQIVANRLAQAIRVSDTVTRLGGDEFVLLLEDVNAAQLDAMLDKIRSQVCTPCDINGYQPNISVSMGASIFPEHGHNIEALMHYADLAMYAAKKHKKSSAPQSSAIESSADERGG